MTVQNILLQFEPKPENLLRAIKEINKQLGYFNLESAKKVAHYFEVSVAAVYSAASFYDEIKTKQRIPLHIQVCDGTNCLGKRSDQIIELIEAFFHLKVEDTNNKKIKIERTSCNGNCLAGPVVIINGTVFERVTPESVGEILKGYV